MTWTFVRQFSLQIFAFVQGIILARLLNPSDYGLIAMTTFFFAITGCFTDSGFTTALIRKKDRTKIDYSTVFITNVCLTALFATVLCICSPLIARFYNQPILESIVCANACLLFLNSFLTIQNTKLTIDLDFKAQNLIRITTTIIIGLVTIAMAFMGCGIWSLIWPNFLLPVLNGIMYWKRMHWFPGVQFSWKSWKEFFSFGSNMLISNLISTIYNNLYPLVIGKKFNATQLGYYTRAQGYADLAIYPIMTTLGPVAFPLLCDLQKDSQRLTYAYRKLIRLTAYLSFPLLIGLSSLSKPVIIILVTEKWNNSIPLLQILCFAFMWNGIQQLNLDMLQVKGRSDLFLKIELLKKAICIVILIFSIYYGLLFMCICLAISSLLSFLINTYFTSKILTISFKKQIYDILPSLFYALCMGGIIQVLNTFIDNMYLQLFTGISIGVSAYILISYIFKSEELSYCKLLIKNKILSKRSFSVK